MAVTLDTGELRTGLPVRAYPPPAVPADPGRRANAMVVAEPPVPGDGGRGRYLVPALLVAGWGGLFAYCAAYLREDLPFRPTSSVEAARQTDGAPKKIVVLPELTEEPTREPAGQPTREAARPASVAVAAPPPAPPVSVPSPVVPAPAATPRPAQAPVADYVGVWGPTPAACGSPSRRRGYLPATITADRARAGRTVCSFHDGHRTGSGWLMAADCSDRGRRWTSQVRLVVDGDRLTWTSNRGVAAYVRCGRRAG